MRSTLQTTLDDSILRLAIVQRARARAFRKTSRRVPKPRISSPIVLSGNSAMCSTSAIGGVRVSRLRLAGFYQEIQQNW